MNTFAALIFPFIAALHFFSSRYGFGRSSWEEATRAVPRTILGCFVFVSLPVLLGLYL